MARTCLFSYDPEIYFNPNADAFLVDQPQASYKVSNRKNLFGSKQQTPPDGTPTNEDTALNAHSANASLVLTLTYYHNKSEKYIAGNRNNYLHHLSLPSIATAFRRRKHPPLSKASLQTFRQTRQSL